MARRRGEGTIYQRADGRYEGAVFVTTVAGKRKRVRVYGKTWDEAHEALTKIKRQEQQHVPFADRSWTVAAFLDDWLAEAATHVRPNTLAGYESIVRIHVKPLIGKKRVAALTVRDVRKMLDDLRAAGMKPRMLQYTHAVVRMALEHAVRDEVVTRNVARLVKLPQPTHAELRPLTVDEARTLLATARDDALYPLYLLVLVLGLRRSEALALHWADLDLSRRTPTVRVHRSLHRVGGELRYLATKTSRSQRTVPLPRLVADALRQHHDRELIDGAGQVGPEDPVFTTWRGTPIDPRNFSRLFGKLCEIAGIRVVRLHDTRHTCVSLLLALGVPPRVVMEIVGHSAIEMTMNVYGHVELDMQRQALDRLNDLLAGSAG